MELHRIAIYPIKSLDPVWVDEVGVTPGGSLDNDRAYAIFDRDGRVVNGKRTDRIHRLRSSFSPDFAEVCLAEEGEATGTRFDLRQREPLDRWLSDYFGFEVAVRHDAARGHPDDSVASGPTLVGHASLCRIAEWFPSCSVASVRRRFRANLEVDGGPPFAEDALFAGPDERKPFAVGGVAFLGHNPCQRCVVPPRDPDTGERTVGFQKRFAEMRERELPGWADARRFDHYYRLAVNTSIPTSEAGKRLRIGDRVVL